LRQAGRRAALSSFLRRALQGGAEALQRTWLAFQPRRETRVEVVIADRDRARVIQRQVRLGLRGLRHTLGSALHDNLRVVVQQVIEANRPAEGYYDFFEDRNHGRIAVVRLALCVNGQARPIDDVLATLASLCFGVAEVGWYGSLVHLARGPKPPTTRDDRPAHE
jgi:hypothetical protein